MRKDGNSTIKTAIPTAITNKVGENDKEITRPGNKIPTTRKAESGNNTKNQI